MIKEVKEKKERKIDGKSGQIAEEEIRECAKEIYQVTTNMALRCQSREKRRKEEKEKSSVQKISHGKWCKAKQSKEIIFTYQS